MVKVLVTGGAGFIGSHLVDRLLEEGNEVVILDNLSSNKKENINPKAKFIKGDIKNINVFKKFSNIETVFHLASLTHVIDSIKKPKECFDSNVIGSFNILEFCRKNDTKIVFTSSAAVYGNLNRPAKEDDFCRPISPYGKYKLFVEELIKSYNEFYGIPYTTFRLFNVFGPRATAGIIKNLLECAKKHTPFYLYGNGKQRRDFIFVEDVVKILVQHKKAENMTLNVGTGISTSLLDLIKLVKEITKCDFDIIKKEKFWGDIEISCADITNFKKIFPKFQFTDLRRGISKTFSLI
jgi:UDP-glucose 4-epimerase